MILMTVYMVIFESDSDSYSFVKLVIINARNNFERDNL